VICPVPASLEFPPHFLAVFDDPVDLLKASIDRFAVTSGKNKRDDCEEGENENDDVPPDGQVETRFENAGHGDAAREEGSPPRQRRALNLEADVDGREWVFVGGLALLGLGFES
jgi:hypothetical protein